MASELHILQNDMWQVGILPGTGASIAFGRIQRKGQWVDFMRPTPEADYGNSSKCASFLLIPWSNRLRDARFRFNGQEYQLQPTANDGTAMHGVVRRLPMTILEADGDSIRMSVDSSQFKQLNFPFKFSAIVEYRLEDADFVTDITLKNEDEQPFPAGFGTHPYFVRELGDPGNAIWLEIPCDQQYELVNKMAVGPAVPLPPALDFRQLRPLEPEKYPQEWDYVLTGYEGTKPIRFFYHQSGTEIAFYSDTIFKHIVFYAPVGKPFFAVEPVSNTNDGFNLYEAGVPDTGVFVLESGESKQGAMRLRVIKA